MIRAAENFVLCEIEKKFQDEQGGISIDTTWDPGEHATLEGIVVSPPERFSSDRHRTITRSVNKGDKIFFSYSVVFEYALQPDDDTPVYKNLLVYKGNEYWKVDMGEIFCIEEPNGDLKMVTENILIEPIDQGSGIVKAMPNVNVSCNVRDIVCFQPKFVQHYNILGKEHYILPIRRVLAKA